MKKNIGKSIYFGLILSLVSCTNDSVSDLTEVTPELTEVTYSARIVQIMDNHCVSCHGAVNPSAGLSLHTYEKVRESVEEGELIERISLPQGNSLMMPQGGNRLSQNDINAVITWEQNNFPN